MLTQEKRIIGKQWVLFLLVLLILLSVAGGVYAYVTATTGQISNRFDPVVVTCQVEESFDGAVKRDVCIRNTGDINAFIRAMVVVSWVDGNGKVLSAAPVEGQDYTVEWGSNLWTKGSDGFWYHTSAVAPNATTGHLIRMLTPGTTPEGYQLQVQIIATAIQADPSAAAESAWGVGVNGYVITPS